MVSAVTISVGGFQTGIPTDKSARHQKASCKLIDGDVKVTVAYRIVWLSLPSGIPVWPRHLYMERTNQLSFVCVREREPAETARKSNYDEGKRTRTTLAALLSDQMGILGSFNQ